MNDDTRIELHNQLDRDWALGLQEAVDLNRRIRRNLIANLVDLFIEGMKRGQPFYWLEVYLERHLWSLCVDEYGNLVFRETLQDLKGEVDHGSS